MILIRSSLKEFLPPILWRLLASLKNNYRGKAGGVDDTGGFLYGFSSFESAAGFVEKQGSSGYASQSFISKLVAASSLVRDGKAVYERDTYIFQRVLYSWPLLSALLLAAQKKKVFCVVDFGGGLGSTYRQNKKFLELVESQIKWSVIEQKEIVNIGRESFENIELKFYADLDEISEDTIDLFILSGTLCYLSDPYQIIERISLLKPSYIVLDRTPFLESDADAYCVQYVPANIFQASYPVTIFGRKKLFDLLSNDYTLVEKWMSDDQPDKRSSLEGSIWRIK
jgi:putative methyltransferase (TIGR04325 family)